MNRPAFKPDVIPPSEAAARLGLKTGALVALIRKYRYEFTELAAGGRPGDRGRNRWGLTEAQFEAILRGQRRQFQEPEPPAADRTAPALPSSDGRSLLRRGGWLRS